MSTIVTIKEMDTWEGLAPTIERVKFIEKHLMTFEGSAGFGGIEASDPIQAAKDWARENKADSDQHGFYMEVTDTQSPVGTESHKRQYYPRATEENNFNVEWLQ